MRNLAQIRGRFDAIRLGSDRILDWTEAELRVANWLETGLASMRSAIV